MEVVAMDIGYGFSKVRADGVQHIFPSVTGTADQSRFDIAGKEDKILTVGSDRFIVGQDAIDGSTFVPRFENREWFKTNQYMALVHYALLKTKPTGSIRLVTGLPIAYYDDKEQLSEMLRGAHTVCNGTNRRFVVEDVRVIPQPFGSLFACAMTDTHVHDASLLTGKVGVIDVGSKTTNLLTAHRGKDVYGKTSSIALGGWDIVRSLRSALVRELRGGEWPDYELAEAVRNRRIGYDGGQVSIGHVVDSVCAQFSEQVKAESTHLWNEGKNLDALIITGGGAHIVEGTIRDLYSTHKRVIVTDKPQMANVTGYYRYGLFLERAGR